MKRVVAVLLASALVLGLAACGESDPPAGPGAGGGAPAAAPATPEERTQAALLELFAAVRAGDGAAAAAHVVYRGKDQAASWKRLCDHAQAEDRMRVDGMVAQVRRFLGDGEPEFLEFRSKRESEGQWMAWKVKGANGTAWCACLDIEGTVALGDVDKA